MTKCAIYCRISKDRVGAGLGVERQEGECAALAAQLGYTVVDVYVDNDISAYSGKPRPEYRRLLADIAEGRVDVVLAWHTDRLHRSPSELEEYIATCDARGVATQTVKAGRVDLSTPSGRMVARQLGAVARYEVEHAAERIQSKKQEMALVGRFPGGRRPYGYEDDGMTLRLNEAAVAAEVTDALLAGASLRGQAARLNAAGHVTATGLPWTPTELSRMLVRARNAALRVHRGQIIGKAAWPPLVAEEKWRALHALLTDPGRRDTPGPGRKWLLSGIALCGVCGDTVQVGRAGSPGSKRPAYHCRLAKHVVRAVSDVDRFVEAVVVERLRREDLRDLLTPTRPGVDLTALNAEEANLSRRLDVLADDLTLDERVLARRTVALNRRLAEIARIKADAGRGSVLKGVADAPDPGAAYLALEDLGRRQAVVRALITVTILRSKTGRPHGWRKGETYFDPDSVDIQ